MVGEIPQKEQGVENPLDNLGWYLLENDTEVKDRDEKILHLNRIVSDITTYGFALEKGSQAIMKKYRQIIPSHIELPETNNREDLQALKILVQTLKDKTEQLKNISLLEGQEQEIEMRRQLYQSNYVDAIWSSFLEAKGKVEIFAQLLKEKTGVSFEILTSVAQYIFDRLKTLEQNQESADWSI